MGRAAQRVAPHWACMDGSRAADEPACWACRSGAFGVGWCVRAACVVLTLAGVQKYFAFNACRCVLFCGDNKARRQKYKELCVRR